MSESQYAAQQDKLDTIVQNFIDNHPDYVSTAREKDAALKSLSDADIRGQLLLYPGVVALAAHEEANALYRDKQFFQARQLAELAHTRSGIDIHPGTTIGADCFIDHGTGVVIGETAKLGKGTLLYHNATLGAYGNPLETDPVKLAHRHPELGDNCTVSTGAKILGPVHIADNVAIGPDALIYGSNLVIGSNVTVGAGAVIGGGTTVADGIRIGAGAKIAKGSGVIDISIPPNSLVSRDKAGELRIVDPELALASHATAYAGKAHPSGVALGL